jgi:hypothetical protein
MPECDDLHTNATTSSCSRHVDLWQLRLQDFGELAGTSCSAQGAIQHLQGLTRQRPALRMQSQEQLVSDSTAHSVTVACNALHVWQDADGFTYIDVWFAHGSTQ